jgi:hypothetical protein
MKRDEVERGEATTRREKATRRERATEREWNLAGESG